MEECGQPGSKRFKAWGVYEFPDLHDLQLKFSTAGIGLCRDENCEICRGDNQRETASIHLDCFRLFIRSRDLGKGVLNHLGVMASWREPWTTVPSLKLRPRRSVTSRGVQFAIDKLGFEALGMLPVELHHRIRTFCEDSPLWRYASVLEFVDQVSTTLKPFQQNQQTELAVPIRNVGSWSRGKDLLRQAHKVDAKHVLRISIDYRGIAQIEWLEEVPRASYGLQSEYFAYILGTASEFDGVTVDFEVSPKLQNDYVAPLIEYASSVLFTLTCRLKSVVFQSGIDHVHQCRYTNL